MKGSWPLIAIAVGSLFLGGAPRARADHKRDRHDVHVARDRHYDRERQARDRRAWEEARRREEARARHAALRRQERRRRGSGSIFNSVREADRHRR